MNQKKKWKTGQRLVMNNNILDIGRQGGRVSPASTNNKRMEAITTVVLERDPPGQERPLLRAYLATRPDTTSLGINDPNPPGTPHCPRHAGGSTGEQQRRIKTPRPAEPRAADANEEPHKIPKKSEFIIF